MASWLSLGTSLAWRAARNPRTGAALVRVGVALPARRLVHGAFPFLPLPDREYLRWRMHTAYGDAETVPPADDIVRYARWAVKGR